MRKKVYIYQPKGFEPIPVVAGFKGTTFILMSFEEEFVLLYDMETNELKEIDLDYPEDTSGYMKPHFNERKEFLRLYHEYCADCVKERDNEETK